MYTGMVGKEALSQILSGPKSPIHKIYAVSAYQIFNSSTPQLSIPNEVDYFQHTCNLPLGDHTQNTMHLMGNYPN